MTFVYLITRPPYPNLFKFFYLSPSTTTVSSNYMSWPVGRALTHSSLQREVLGSNLGPVKLDTVLLTAGHHNRCNISLKRAMLPAWTTTRRWAQ